MNFETPLIYIRLSLVECKTLLNSWGNVANAEYTYETMHLEPIGNDCHYNGSVNIEPTFGLCANVFTNLYSTDVRGMFERFPKWSGSYGFPIGEGDKEYNVGENKYLSNDRKELLEHCIELMETFVKEKSNVN